MENLNHILNEEGEIMATPSNTIGAGNPTLPGLNGELGSGDVVTVPIGKTKQKKSKKYKKYSKLKDRLLKKLFNAEEE